MKQPEDGRTLDWVGGETGKTGGGMPDATRRRGAYAGAVKIGCDNHQARARTKLSQAEFSKLAGISERTLRTWERGDLISSTSLVAIRSTLAKLGRDPGPAQRRPARYYDPHTGSTWSGKGQRPAWLQLYLARGRTLAEFERTTG